MNISYARLHSTLFIPTSNGKGINLKETLDTASPDNVSKELKLTLDGSVLKIDVMGGSALIPLTSVLMMVPGKN